MASNLANPPLTDPESILAQEESLVFTSFTTDTAWELGCLLRASLLAHTSLSATISITHANSSHLLFHSITRPGASPDNDTWVTRKRNTVLRFGRSSWYMGRKFNGDEELFGRIFCLGERSGDYAIHGGGVPVRVKGVDGVVGVIVVSGLSQEEDHQVIVDVVRNYIDQYNSREF